MLAARGIIVSHQTIHLWAEKFGKHFDKDIRKRSAGRIGASGISTKLSSPFGTRNIGSGGPSIRTDLFSTFWSRAAEVPGRQSV